LLKLLHCSMQCMAPNLPTVRLLLLLVCSGECASRASAAAGASRTNLLGVVVLLLQQELLPCLYCLLSYLCCNCVDV
jgi:hypothetical protein